VGDSALFNNGNGAAGATQAIGNTALGSKALYSNTVGSYNTAVGSQALYSSDTNGNYNTVAGYQAGFSTSLGPKQYICWGTSWIF
jgi:hypothetical protein